MEYESTFLNPQGATSRGQFWTGIAILVIVGVFFHLIGRTGDYGYLLLTWPLFAVLAKRLRAMGQNPVIAAVPAGLAFAYYLIVLKYPALTINVGASTAQAIGGAALVTTLAVVAWGSMGKDSASAAAAA